VGKQSQKHTDKLQMRMNPNKIGKKLGIGVRVAGRIAKQRAKEHAQGRAAEAAGVESSRSSAQSAHTSPQSGWPASTPNYSEKVREIGKSSQRFSRAAGRGVGGFLRPFGRVGGILWLEVTGFFFGLFALYFAVDMWRARLGYAAGPQHSHFLISAGLTAVFIYLSASAFWRAGRK
jgi:hypothetical protein